MAQARQAHTWRKNRGPGFDRVNAAYERCKDMLCAPKLVSRNGDLVIQDGNWQEIVRVNWQENSRSHLNRARERWLHRLLCKEELPHELAASPDCNEAVKALSSPWAALHGSDQPQLEKVVSALRKAAKAAGQNGAPPAPGAAGDLHPAVNGDVAPSAAPAMLFNPAGALAPAAADPPLPGINGAPARMHTDALLPGVSDLALPSPGLLPPGQGGLLAAAAGDNSPPATPRHLAPRAAATLLPGGAAAVMTGTHGPALPAANCHMAPRTTGSSAGAPAGKGRSRTTAAGRTLTPQQREALQAKVAVVKAAALAKLQQVNAAKAAAAALSAQAADAAAADGAPEPLPLTLPGTTGDTAGATAAESSSAAAAGSGVAKGDVAARHQDQQPAAYQQQQEVEEDPSPGVLQQQLTLMAGVNGVPLYGPAGAVVPGPAGVLPASADGALSPAAAGAVLPGVNSNSSPAAASGHLAPRFAATLLPGGAAAVMTDAPSPALPDPHGRVAPGATGDRAGTIASQSGRAWTPEEVERRKTQVAGLLAKYAAEHERMEAAAAAARPYSASAQAGGGNFAPKILPALLRGTTAGRANGAVPPAYMTAAEIARSKARAKEELGRLTVPKRKVSAAAAAEGPAFPTIEEEDGIEGAGNASSDSGERAAKRQRRRRPGAAPSLQEQLPPAPPVATEAEAAAAAAAAAAQAATPGARTAPRAPASSGASGQQGGSPLSEAQLQLGDALIAVGGENNAYHRLDLIRRLVPLVTPVGHGMLRQPNAASSVLFYRGLQFFLNAIGSHPDLMRDTVLGTAAGPAAAPPPAAAAAAAPAAAAMPAAMPAAAATAGAAGGGVSATQPAVAGQAGPQAPAPSTAGQGSAPAAAGGNSSAAGSASLPEPVGWEGCGPWGGTLL